MFTSIPIIPSILICILIFIFYCLFVAANYFGVIKDYIKDDSKMSNIKRRLLLLTCLIPGMFLIYGIGAGVYYLANELANKW